MKDLRFTGTISGTYVDVWLRTDMINADAVNFNINQIQFGEDFSPNDAQSEQFLKFFSNTFKLQHSDIQTAKTFATDNGLGLRLYDNKGNHTTLIDDSSLSE